MNWQISASFSSVCVWFVYRYSVFFFSIDFIASSYIGLFIHLFDPIWKYDQRKLNELCCLMSNLSKLNELFALLKEGKKMSVS